MPTILTPQEFVAKWRAAPKHERAESHEHFIDLCRLFGHPTPGEHGPSGLAFTFEAGVEKSQGGHGFADVWYEDHFGWEYKGKSGNLDKAYDQLRQYQKALHNPPLLIVSDMERIVVHPNFVNNVNRTQEFTLDDMVQPDKLELLRAIFYDPFAFQSPQTKRQVTEAAAREFAKLADLLRQYGTAPQSAAHFLIRVLFCLFAEDIGLLPNQIFTRMIRANWMRPPAFARQLHDLFALMATGGSFGIEEIRKFDGGLFNNSEALTLDSEGMQILSQVCDLDWSSIEPSILGTLFARSLDPDERSRLGAQYTSKEDILAIVEPVLMAPLCVRWDEIKARARELAALRDSAKGKQTKEKFNREIRDLLTAFATELANIKVLDPASGSGNFLYVSLKELLDLWQEVSTFGSQLGLALIMPDVTPSPSPTQMHGIETNTYAHELANTSVWIGYIQWRRDNGFGFPPEPILKRIEVIQQMDAILTYDKKGQPKEPEWPRVDVIVGNPPFLGDKKMRSELGHKYVEDLRSLYGDRIPGQSDFVCYWFEKARAMIEARKVQRAGLLATNSIRKGANRVVLERICQSGQIFMAWSDREWVLDGAAVRVSMVGFDDGTEHARILDGRRVTSINADLTSLADVTKAKALDENKGLCFLGMMKGGPFDIDDGVAKRMLRAPRNPNGRLNSVVIKRRLGAQDITGVPSNTWIIDFVDAEQAEAAKYELPFRYVREVVKPVRDQSRDPRMKKYWWLHGRSRPALRKAIRGLRRCIVTPEVSKHRVFVWMDTDIIPDHTCHVIAREDDYLFGVLHSHVHELWSLAVCNYIGAGNDPRYNSSKTFETFPFPWAPGQEPKDDPRVQHIGDAARELVRKRDEWLNDPNLSETELKKRTLTNLYNERPPWLNATHRKLDQVVFDAYGWPDDLSDDEILERLLKLNLEGHL